MPQISFVELRRSDDPGTLYARGTARCVWVDYTAGRSVPLPERLREVLEHPHLVHAC